MELDNLRSIWKEIDKIESARSPLKSEEILQLSQGKTQDNVAKIKRNILLEIILLGVFAGLFSVFFIFNHDWIQQISMAFITVICVLSGLYYWKKYQEISQIEINSLNIKHALKKLIYTLESYLRIYQNGSMLITPIGVLSGFFYGFSIGQDQESNLEVFDQEVLIIAGISSVIITLLMYPFIKWYIRLLYGQHLEHLKSCLDELEQES